MQVRRAAQLVAILLLLACEAVPTNTGDVASAPRTASPLPPSPSPPSLIAQGNCTGLPTSLNATNTNALGMDQITLAVPPGWSDRTSQVTGITALIYIQAP